MLQQKLDISDRADGPFATGRQMRAGVPERDRRAPGMELHMKGFILSRLAEASKTGLWDYEIMQMVFARYNRAGAYWRGEIRATLTDLHSGALIDEIMDGLDDGRYFGNAKILMKFRLSRFGAARVAQTGLG